MFNRVFTFVFVISAMANIMGGLYILDQKGIIDFNLGSAQQVPLGSITIANKESGTGKDIFACWALIRSTPNTERWNDQCATTHTYNDFALGSYTIEVNQSGETHNFDRVEPTGFLDLTAGGSIQWTVYWKPKISGSRYTLTVNKTGNGSGAVTGSGINCGADCSESYEPGATVEFFHSEDSGSTWGGWSGACTGPGCIIVMDSNKTLNATFNGGSSGPTPSPTPSPTAAPPQTGEPSIDVNGHVDVTANLDTCFILRRADDNKTWDGCTNYSADRRGGKYTIEVQPKEGYEFPPQISGDAWQNIDYGRENIGWKIIWKKPTAIAAKPTCGGATPSSSATVKTGGSFSVAASDVKNANAVWFAAWSEINGQDDIIWYPASNQGNGTWKVELDLAKHPGLGSIAVHVYMDPDKVFCGTANFTREQPQPRLTPPSTGTVFVSSFDKQTQQPINACWKILRANQVLYDNQCSDSSVYADQQEGSYDLQVYPPAGNDYEFPPTFDQGGSRVLHAGERVGWNIYWTKKEAVSAPTLSIDTSSLPLGKAGQSYSADIKLSGITNGFQTAITSGILPPLLRITPGSAPDTVRIEGQAIAAGKYYFTLQVSSGGRSVTKDLSIVIGKATGTLVFESYEQGTGNPVTACVRVYNTQTSANAYNSCSNTWDAEVSPGTYALEVSAPDGSSAYAYPPAFDQGGLRTVVSEGKEGWKIFWSRKNTPLTITTTSLPQATAGASYSTDIFATGGTGVYSWSISAGSLPQGLAFGSGTNSNSTSIGGKPAIAGTYNFMLNVNSGGQAISKQFTIEVFPAYPGFYMKTDKLSYLPGETVTLTLGRVDGSSTPFAVNLYAYDGFKDKILIQAGIPAGLNTKVTIKLTDWPLFSRASTYTLLICNARVACDSGINTNATGFNIVQSQPVIQLISPNGKEALIQNHDYTISWQSQNAPADAQVVVRLLNRGGYYAELASQKSPTDSFVWRPGFVADSGYAVEVILQTFQTDLARDVSDATFSIVASGMPSVQLIVPNGGETLTSNSAASLAYPISASIGAFEKLSNPKLDFELIKNKSVLGALVPAPVAVTSQPSSWTLGWGQTYYYDASKTRLIQVVPGSDYQIRVTLYDGANRIAQDDSDGTFNIVEKANPNLVSGLIVIKSNIAACPKLLGPSAKSIEGFCGTTLNYTVEQMGDWTFQVAPILGYKFPPIVSPVGYQKLETGQTISWEMTWAKESAENQKPSGFLDGITSDGTISGWAYDPDDAGKSIAVHVYFDGPAGSGNNLTADIAGNSRPDVNAALNITGDHGFQIQVPAALRDGKQHTAFVHAIDSADSSVNQLLIGSGKIFIISGRQAPIKPPATLPVPGSPANPAPGSGALPGETSSSGLFDDGTLVLDKGIIYFIEYGKKRPFVSMDVFNGLGYKITNVISSNISSIRLGEPISTSQQRHPRGTVVISGSTLYFMGGDLRYPYPSQEVFQSWGHTYEIVVPANSFDLSVPVGPPSGSGNRALKRDTFVSGHLDGISPDGNYIEGWAYDPQKPEQPVEVTLTLPYTQGGSFVKILTRFERPDVNSAKGIGGKHGFRFPIAMIPERYKDGKNYQVSAYASPGNILLGNSWIYLSADVIRSAKMPDSHRYDSSIDEMLYSNRFDQTLQKAEEQGLAIVQYTVTDPLAFKFKDPETNEVLLTVIANRQVTISPYYGSTIATCLDGDLEGKIIFNDGKPYGVTKNINTVNLHPSGDKQLDQKLQVSLSNALKNLNRGVEADSNIPRFIQRSGPEDVSLVPIDINDPLFNLIIGANEADNTVMIAFVFQGRDESQEHTTIYINSDLINRLAGSDEEQFKEFRQRFDVINYISHTFHHEFGHTLGLGHSKNEQSNMWSPEESDKPIKSLKDLPEPAPTFNGEDTAHLKDIFGKGQERLLDKCRDEGVRSRDFENLRHNAERPKSIADREFRMYELIAFRRELPPPSGPVGGGKDTFSCVQVGAIIRCNYSTPAF